eukprot:3951112-Prymnesium_polylepis.1
MGHLSLDFHGFGSSDAQVWRRDFGNLWTHVRSLSHRVPRRRRSPALSTHSGYILGGSATPLG